MSGWSNQGPSPLLFSCLRRERSLSGGMLVFGAFRAQVCRLLCLGHSVSSVNGISTNTVWTHIMMLGLSSRAAYEGSTNYQDILFLNHLKSKLSRSSFTD